MIDFQKDYILENDKVLLRPLVENDFDQLLRYSLNELDIWDFNAFGANGEDNLRQYIKTAIENRKKQTDYVFVVIDKLQNKMVGSTRFYLINQVTKTLELGYTWYGKDHQGTYINKNSKYLLLEFALEQLGYERVAFKANIANKRSINAMKSIGCVEEGVLRNFSFDAKGNRIDLIVLSILKDEWINNVKSNLQEKINRK
ncbi:GCN5 family acetyltransferase [Pseudalgibacter alginicilyticus]|uniref:GCN5 family acetyltransferase n=1 Tax=Pseudalgibacter alginicilyticus TaxID=1736674 RepID=A0A0P0CDU1_9FLAO|nr:MULTISPECIES: GNAT family protein [Flavobacteriaceae]ALJ04119.1 GCN5 family acetyltransferase [Pseudalgibacter alginicilyticus]